MQRWPAPIDHTYIICDPKLEPERGKYITEWFASNRIDPTCYTMEMKYYGKTVSDEDALKLYDPCQKRELPIFRKEYCSCYKYNMKKTEISLCMNWHHLASDAVAKKHNIVMMLESDVLFNVDFLEKLDAAMKMLPSEWDFLSISAGANLFPIRELTADRELGWFPCTTTPCHTRTTDAMIFKVEMLEKITKEFYPVGDVLDWELNYHLEKYNSRTYWLDPPILKQGSGSVYETSL